MNRRFYSVSVSCFFDRELRSNSLTDKLALNVRGMLMMMKNERIYYIACGRTVTRALRWLCARTIS